MAGPLLTALLLVVQLLLPGGSPALGAQPGGGEASLARPVEPGSAVLPGTRSAAEIVAAAVAHYRGVTSEARLRMVVHRPDWERSMSLHAWTAGRERSLVRVVAPARDAGNATLLRDGAMWSYAPKVNRVIRIPASMMGQNWMGSDFSNRDVARSDDILAHYEHELTGSSEHQGMPVFHVESRPLPEAPVVWGHEQLRIRADYVLLEHAFYDQRGELVKRMQALEVRELGGRPVATVMRMGKVAHPDEWTEMHTEAVVFDQPLPEQLFTLVELRNPSSASSSSLLPAQASSAAPPASPRAP
jgi:hypothetical protein